MCGPRVSASAILKHLIESQNIHTQISPTISVAKSSLHLSGSIMVDVETGKYISAILCAVLTMVGAVLPICVRTVKWTGRFQSLAGGVFLGGCLAHLLPDSIDEIKQATSNPYPISGAVAAVTFFVLSAIEILSSQITKNATQQEEPTVKDNGFSIHNQEDADKPPEEEQVAHDDSMSSIDDNSDKLYSSKFKFLSVSVSTLYIIMAVHSIIEGLAMGIVADLGGVIGMACAVAGHKPVEAFALGLIILKDKPTCWVYWCMMVFYVLLSPVGAIIAIQLRQIAGPMVLGVLSALSAGTFLFITSDEWATIFVNRTTFSISEKLWHLGLFLIGLMWMVLIALVDE